MNFKVGRWWFWGGSGIALFLALTAFFWLSTQNNLGQEGLSAVTPLGSPATARMDREMARLLVIVDKLENDEEVDGERCQRCSFLAQTANGYRDKASAALSDVRNLESTLSNEIGSDVPGRRASLERQLVARQSAAGRALAGLKSFAAAASSCELEKLCTRDDPQRAAQSVPLDCKRDRQDVIASVARISALAEGVITQARLCQTISCPVMNCARSAELLADLEIAEMSMAELAGGRTALRGAERSGQGTSMATVLGGIERALVRLALDSAVTSLAPSDLSARAHDMRTGLVGWVAQTEVRRGVDQNGWRISALMGEIDVAAEWALSGDTVEYTHAYFEALSRAMLSAARLDAALALESDENAGRQSTTVSGPICGAVELGNAYLITGRAIAALGFCRAKSACIRSSGIAWSRGAQRSASDGEIGALAAIIGALPLGAERQADATVARSLPAEVSMNREGYLAGEVITVSVDAAPSSCLVSGGAIAIVRAGTAQTVEQRYHLKENTTSEVLLAAPNEPGHYMVRVFASPDRGGQVLSEHPFAVGQLGPGCEGFTGIWDTQFGRLHMVDRDGILSGSYRRGAKALLPGLLFGERTGRTFQGTWLSELGRGGTKLRLLDGGTRFRGTWGARPGNQTNGGPWNGDCLGQ